MPGAAAGPAFKDLTSSHANEYRQEMTTRYHCDRRQNLEDSSTKQR